MKNFSPGREERAKPSRMQVFRMARIVALLKKNRLPSAETLLKEYEKLEFEENQLIRAKYSLRTVYRDIDSLKNDFHCPIEYDRTAKGYYLTDHDWEFNCPALQCSCLENPRDGEAWWAAIYGVATTEVI